jgi:peptidoglycan-N-acetylglucosamine deacetylase
MFSHWKPSLAIKASAALHVGTLAACGAGLAWPWGVGIVAANHVALTAAGLWPRSTWLGANTRRLPATAAAAQQVALTIDDGPHPQVTPRVLDLLDAAQAKASFFCIGAQVAAHPDIAQDIVRRGHRIENHSYAHRHHFSFMGLGALRREITAAQDIIERTCGQRPAYFRAPAGLRSPLLDPVLQQLGLRLVSWTRRGFDTVTPEPQKVLTRLERRLAAGDILLLHDGHCARSPSGQPVVLEVLPALLQRLKSLGLRGVALPPPV